VLLAEVVTTSVAVAGVPGRTAKIEAIADLLRRVPPDEAPIVVAFLSGDLIQRQIGVGYAALADLAGGAWGIGESAAGSATTPAAEPTLTIAETDAAFEAIGAALGPGSQAQRRALLAGLLDRATGDERWFLARLVAGDLRQGALEGVMTEAVARAAGAPVAEVRRAHQVRGSLPEVARAALAAARAGQDTHASPGTEAVLAALRAFTLRIGQPVRPMLAASAPSLDDALGKFSPAAIEWKIDGIRIQIHRAGGKVMVFTRTLDDITDRVPEMVAIGLSLGADPVLVDGEAVALRPDGRPRPFQVTSARVASAAGAAGNQAATVPLTAFLFDLLHADGQDLVDEPAAKRFERLAAIAPADLLIPRLVTADRDEAAAFASDAIRRGHEGVVVKSLDAPYRAGRRGGEWIKVKPRVTLDLVILAVEWGHGRRTGWLSNLHLGARDPDTGGFVMLGKTFKGLTDAMLGWQTGRLLELANPPVDAGPADSSGKRPQAGRPWVVRVHPELVAEIAFDGVQASRRYPGGVALRFARVLRYREDKRPEEADTIETVRALWTGESADA
jgi:ATP-dependent DNA ligase I